MLLYSLIRICKHLGLDPFAYLRDFLARVATQPMRRIAERRTATQRSVSPLPPDRPPAASRTVADNSCRRRDDVERSPGRRSPEINSEDKP